MLMNNEDAEGQAAFLGCEQQAVENGRKGDQTMRLGFAPPTHFYEVYTPEVPVCQVPNTLCRFMPLLFPLPEMFSPLTCLVNFSSSFKTQISDHLL